MDYMKQNDPLATLLGSPMSLWGFSEGVPVEWGAPSGQKEDTGWAHSPAVKHPAKKSWGRNQTLGETEAGRRGKTTFPGPPSSLPGFPGAPASPRWSKVGSGRWRCARNLAGGPSPGLPVWRWVNLTVKMLVTLCALFTCNLWAFCKMLFKW